MPEEVWDDDAEVRVKAIQKIIEDAENKVFYANACELLEPLLSDEDDEVKMNAAKAFASLSEHGYPGMVGVNSLAFLLRDTEAIRLSASRALANFPVPPQYMLEEFTEESQQLLLEALGDRQRQVRVNVARFLSAFSIFFSFHSQETRSSLERLLWEDDDRLKEEALGALKYYQDEGMAPHLVKRAFELQSSADEAVARGADDLLLYCANNRMDNEMVVKVLASFVEKLPRDGEQALSIRVLATRGAFSERSFIALVEKMADDEQIKGSFVGFFESMVEQQYYEGCLQKRYIDAIEATLENGFVPGRKTVRTLVGMLSAKEVYSSRCSAAVLAVMARRGIVHREALEPLVALLSDERMTVKGEVVWALARMADVKMSSAQALYPLLQILQGREQRIDYPDAGTLAMMVIRELNYLDHEILRGYGEWVRGFAAETLTEMVELELISREDVLKPLVKLQFDPDETLRERLVNASSALTRSHIFREEAQSMLMQSMFDESPTIALSAAGQVAILFRGEHFQNRGMMEIVTHIIEKEHEGEERTDLARAEPDVIGPFSKEELRPLISLLTYDDGSIRRRAAWAIGELAESGICSREALEPLVGLLSSSDTGTRRNATKALNAMARERVCTEKALESLKAALDDVDAVVRNNVAISEYHLWSTGIHSHDVGDLVVDLLQDSSTDVTVNAIILLNELADREQWFPEALEYLDRVLSGEDLWQRIWVVDLISTYATQGIYRASNIKLLVELWSDERFLVETDYEYRFFRLLRDGQFSHDVVDTLLDLMSTGDVMARCRSAEVLRFLAVKGVTSTASLEVLNRLLFDHGEVGFHVRSNGREEFQFRVVRAEAAETLKTLAEPDRSGTGFMLGMALEEPLEVDTYSSICTRHSLAPLNQLLDDRNPTVCDKAAEALGVLARQGICTQDSIGPLCDLVSSDLGTRRRPHHLPYAGCSALGALFELAKQGVCHRDESGLLVHLLSHGDSHIRRGAAEALGALAEKDVFSSDALEPLSRLLQDENEYVRNEAAATLNILADKRMWP